MVLGYRNVLLLQAALAMVLAFLRNIAFKLVYKGDAPPRPGDHSISHKWIENVLRKNGFTDVVVESIKYGANENNRGLVGAITRIEIVYASAHRNNAHLPKRLILKMNKPGFEGRAACIAFRSYREAAFYNTNSVLSLTPARSSSRAPKTSEFAMSNAQQANAVAPKGLYRTGLSKAFGENVPFVWYAYVSATLGELVILQEDVTLHPNCTPLNYVFGNQIWGVPSPVVPPRDVVTTLETVFTVTAKYHATFWNNPELLKQYWMKGTHWYHGKHRHHWEYSISATRAHWESAKKKADAPDSQFKINPRLRSIIDKTLEETNWDDFQAHIKSNPFTLCHGDFHASNMFIFRKEGDESDTPVWFDWSEIGPYEPTSDLAQMLISDVKPEIFKAHSKDLVRNYYDELIKNGVSEKEYSWQTCWNSFCRGGVERWIWLFCLLTDFPIPPNALKYFHDQLLEFINHHCPTEDHFKLKIVAAAL